MDVQPIEILYQDEHLVAINKPAGHLTHSSDTPQPDDLVCLNLLRDQIGQHISVIHRLDRPTSGVLLFGLDKRSAARTQRQFERRQVTKTYYAVINSEPATNQWDCEEPLRKQDDAPVKAAHTTFQVLEATRPTSLADGECPVLTLVEATPHTGRFHQIRRHLLHAGSPIVGDYRYAGIDASDKLGQRLGTGTRMLLQAHRLKFEHPKTGEDLTIRAPMEPLIAKLFVDA